MLLSFTVEALYKGLPQKLIQIANSWDLFLSMFFMVMDKY